MIEIKITDNHETVIDILVYLERTYMNQLNVEVECVEFGVNRMTYTITLEDNR